MNHLIVRRVCDFKISNYLVQIMSDVKKLDGTLDSSSAEKNRVEFFV